MDILNVVAGIITNSDNQILIAQRALNKYLGGLWEFPGGKIEPGETAEKALEREIREELGIEILNMEAWISVKHQYAKYEVFLQTWLIRRFHGQPESKENQTLRWVKRNELSTVQFLEGNREIIERIKVCF